MQSLEWSCPGRGHLCGTRRLCLAGEVMSWRASRSPVHLTGMAGMRGTCPISSCTFSFALLCLSPSSWSPTCVSYGPSVRWALERFGYVYQLSNEDTQDTFWLIALNMSVMVSARPTGDQAPGDWGRQDKPYGGAGVVYGGGDGVDLPRDLVALCSHGPCYHHRLESTHWPPHRHHARCLC